jgi:hypothetical protein
VVEEVVGAVTIMMRMIVSDVMIIVSDVMIIVSDAMMMNGLKNVTGLHQ